MPDKIYTPSFKLYRKSLLLICFALSFMPFESKATIEREADYGITCINSLTNTFPGFPIDFDNNNCGWIDYFLGSDLVLTDNGNGTMTISGTIDNAIDADFDACTSTPCGSDDAWIVNLTLSDMLDWTQFQAQGGNANIHVNCSGEEANLEYWDVTGTLVGTGCNAGRTLTITGPVSPYRLQIGAGAISTDPTCSFGMSTWFETNEGGSPLNSDIYAFLDETCYTLTRSGACDAATSGNTDTDGDNVSNICDVDDDNDGILDTDEGLCTPAITTSWLGTGSPENFPTTSIVGAGDITINTTTNSGNTDWEYYPGGQVNTTDFWSNPSVAGSNRVSFNFRWDTTSEDGQNSNVDGGTETVTISYSTPQINPIIHVDRLGGQVQTGPGNFYETNSSEWTLVDPSLSLVKLSGNAQLVVESDKFYRPAYVNLGTDVNPGGEAFLDSDPVVAAGAGSIQVIGTVTNLVFSITGIGPESNGTYGASDGLEFVFESCTSTDTDSDGIPDYLDVDSDNDSCSDAYESGATTNTSINYQFPDIDSNDDGLVDAVDTNNDGSIDYVATLSLVTDGVSSCPNPCDALASGNTDTDGDNVSDICDIDDDNDGILDMDEGFCHVSPILMKNATATATGLGTSGIPSLDFEIPDGFNRMMYLVVTVERDHTGTPYGDNWDSDVAILGSFAGVPQIDFGPATLNKKSYSYSFVDYDGSQLPTAAAHSLNTYVYLLWDSQMPTGTQSFDFSNFNLPINAGDVFTVNLAVFEGVANLEGGFVETFTNDNITNWSTNENVLANSQPSGVLETDNVLIGYAAASNQSGITGTTGWTTINNQTVPNLMGSYSTDPQVNTVSTENDGVSTIFQMITGVSGNQVSDYSVTESNVLHQVAIVHRIYGCAPTDTDTDNVPDYLDTDSDNDGCSDAYESGATTNTTAYYQFPYIDSNGDGLVDAVDTDNDGATDYVATLSQVTDGISSCPDPCDALASGNTDTDGDNVSDICDLDDDNDGILDTVEDLTCFSNSVIQSLNTVPYPLSTPFQTSTTSPAVISNLADGRMTVTGTVSGTAIWSNGVQIKSNAALGEYIYFQPIQVSSSSTNFATYTVDFTNPQKDVSFVSAGFNGDDSFEITAFNGATPVAITTANLSDFDTGGAQNWIVNNVGNGVFISNAGDGGGTSVQVNFFTTTIPGVITQIVIKSFKNSGATGTCTTGITSFRFCDETPTDTDGDGIADHLDLDSDNDGCYDVTESGGTDGDTDGILDGDGFNAEGQVTTGTVITDGYDGATGNEIVANQVTITTAPTNQVGNSGSSVNFSVIATATRTTTFIGVPPATTPDYSSGSNASGSLLYQWQENGIDLSNTGVYSGANTATLNISNTTGLDGNVYNVIVTHSDNLCINEQYNAILTVNPLLPFSCDESIYMATSTGVGIPSQMYEVNTFTDPFGLDAVGSNSGTLYNALGYREQDDYIYGIIMPTNEVVRIGANGIEENLGAVTGLANPGDFNGVYDSGDVFPDGYLYIHQVYNHTEIYQIDVTTSPPSLVATHNLNQSVYLSDFAYNSVDGKVYGVGDAGEKFMIDPATWTVTTVGTNAPANSYGGAYTDNLGNVYVYANNPGAFYRVDFGLNGTGTGDMTLLSTAPTVAFNDGASCRSSSPLPPDFCNDNVDNDGDGIGDVCDLDDDNDGILDTDETSCLSSPELLSSATANASGATASGVPSLSYEAPNGVSRLMYLVVTIERDHTNGANGSNWATPQPLSGNFSDIPNIGFGSATIWPSRFIYTHIDDTGTDFTSDAIHSLESYIYVLWEADIPTGTNTFDLSGFLLPTNAGDEFSIMVSTFQGVYDLEWTGTLNSLANPGSNTWTASADVLSPNQQTGTTESDNMLIVYGASTDQLSNSLGGSWVQYLSGTIINNNGTYEVNQNSSSTEDDGTSYGMGYITGVTGSQTATFTTNTIDDLGHHIIIERLIGCQPTDTDNDGIPDHLDLDSDDDGCSDAYESGATTNTIANYQFPDIDSNDDGLVDAVDSNDDGLTDYAATLPQVTDGVASCICPNSTGGDTDNDGVDDVCDLDDDNDGIPDNEETCSEAQATADYIINNNLNDSGTDRTPFIASSTTLSIAEGTIDNVLDNDFSVPNGIVRFAANQNIANQTIWEVDYNADISLIYVENDVSNLGNIFDPSYISIGSVVQYQYYDEDLSTWVNMNSQYTIPNDLLTIAGGTIILDEPYPRFIRGGRFRLYGISGTTNADPVVRLENLVIEVSMTRDDYEAVCDTDSDGVPDYLDLDSDNDGIHDVVEAGVLNGTTVVDANNDGIIDNANTDSGLNGFFDNAETTAESGTPNYALVSTDNDGIPDFQDTDSDNDGCSDANEAYSSTSADGADGEQYGVGVPAATNGDGTVTAAAYNTGVVAAVTDANDSSVCDGCYTSSGNVLVGGDFGVADTSADTYYNGTGNGAGNPDNYNTYSRPFPANISTTYPYEPPRPSDGNYTLVTNSIGFSYADSQPLPNFWLDIEDHTEDAPGELGYFALFNAAGSAGTFFSQTVTNLEIGTNYEFSAWIINLINPAYEPYGSELILGNSPIPPNVEIVIEDSNGNQLASYQSGDIINDGNWQEVKMSFLSTTNDIVLSIINNTPGGIGNDFGIDDIEFRAPCNFTIAENDINQTPKNTAVSGNVLTNDIDEEGDNQIVLSATYLNAAGISTNLPLGIATDIYDGANTLAGSITLNTNGTYDFVPATDYIGNIPLNYIAQDDKVLPATDGATLSIIVLEDSSTDGSNNDVIAQDDTNTVEQGGTVTTIVIANDSDPDGDFITVTGATASDGSGGTVTLTSSPQNVYDGNDILAGQASLDGSGNIIFTADVSFEGEVQVDYAITDSNGSTDNAILTVNVLPLDTTNDTYGNDDANTGLQGETLMGNVLTNDYDPEGDSQIVTAVTSSDGTAIVPGAGTATTLTGIGTLEIGTDGSYIFIPTPGFVGTETIEYTVCDNGNPVACETVTLYLTVLPVNATIAENDINQTPMNISVSGNVLTNDTDDEGDNQTVQSATYTNSTGTVVNLPLGVATDIYSGTTLTGSIILNQDGSYDFTPETNYTGTAQIYYVAVDDNGNPATDGATLSIIVLEDSTTDGSNNDVIAQDDTNTVEQGGTVTSIVIANDSDPDGDVITVTGATASDGSGGTVTLTSSSQNIYDANNILAGQASLDISGNIIFIADASFEGEVQMDYTITDSNGSTDAAILTVTVLPLDATNDTYGNDDANTGLQGETLTGNILTNDYDPEGDAQTVTAATSSAGITIVPGAGTATNLIGIGNIEIGTDGAYTFTPRSYFVGNETIEYTVCDNGSPVACETVTLYLTILPINATIAIDDFVNTPIGTPVTSNVLTNDYDNEGDVQTVTIESVMPVSEGTVTLSPNGTFIFVPGAGFTGETSFEYEACDDGTPQACEIATVYIEVLPNPTSAGQPPIANPDINEIEIGQMATGDVLANDYDPDGTEITVDTMTVDTDGDGIPDTAGTIGNGTTVGGIDEDGNPVANAGSLTLETDGSYTFTPAVGFIGEITVEYGIVDEDGETDNTILVIIVNPDYGSTTFATDDAAVTDVDVPVSGNVATNDFDPEGDATAIAAISLDTDGDAVMENYSVINTGTALTVYGYNDLGIYVSAGTIQLGESGDYTYIPASGFVGSAVIAYTICETQAEPECDDATLSLSVLDVNRDYGDAPTKYEMAWHRNISDDNDDRVLDGANDVWLGDYTDFEKTTDASPAADADLYDDGMSFGEGEGQFPTVLNPSTTYNVDVVVNSTSAATVYYGMWIDYDNDGNYDQFYTGSESTTGRMSASIAITTPSDLPSASGLTGTVNVRLRVDDTPFVITDGGGGRTNGEVEDYQNTVVLPVELLYFEGTDVGCSNELRWATVSEENNSFFIIEYSKNGEDFTPLERVEGNGNSSEIIEYSYTHRDVTNIYSYYRLLQVDYDGSMEYSEVVFIKSNCEGLSSDDIRVYPNPSRGPVTIEIPNDVGEEREIEIMVTDVLGRILIQKEITLELGINRDEINLLSFPAGMYMISVIDGGKKIKSYPINLVTD